MRSRAQVLPLAALGLLVPPFAVVSPQSLALLLVLAGLLSLGLAVRGRDWAIPVQALWAVAVLAAWAGISALWSVEPKAALSTVARVAAVALLGLQLCHVSNRFDASARRQVGVALALGLAVAAVALISEYGGGGMVSRLVPGKSEMSLEGMKSIANRAPSVVVLLLAAAIFFAVGAGKRWQAVGLVALTGLAVFLGDNNTAKGALLGAGLVYAASLLAGSRAVMAARVLTLALVAAAPFLTSAIPDPQTSYGQWGWKHASLHHRLTIWRFTGERIAERPLVGWGMDGARAIPGGEDAVTVTRPDGPGGLEEQLLPLHPHNAPLQVWLELGLPGALALVALLWWVIGAIGMLPSAHARAAGLTMLAAALIVACSSFGLWQSWWQSALWIGAALANAVLRWKPAAG